MRILVLLPFVLLVAGLPVRAGEEGEAPSEAEVRAQARQWLADLRSSEYAVREAAREGLERVSAQVSDLLQAFRNDADAEVRRTVRLLLEKVGSDEPETPAPPGDLEALGRVTLEAKGTVPFLLRTLAAGRGLEFVLPEDVGEAWVEVALDDVPFFDALEAVAAAGGLSARGHFDTAGRLTLAHREPETEAPSAAAGPVRVTLAEVTSVRTVGADPARRYVVGLDLDWLPSVQLKQRSTPRDVVAVDARGRGFKPGRAMQNTSWGYGLSTRTVRLDIHLEPDDPEAIEHLEELSFTLPVTLQHDRQVVVFEPLAALELPVTRVLPHEPGEGEDRVTLRGLERPDGEQGPLVVDLVARLGGSPSGVNPEVVLLFEDGSAQSASTGSRFPGADGTLGLRARAWIRNEQAPIAVRISWFRVEEKGDLSFSLTGIPLR